MDEPTQQEKSRRRAASFARQFSLAMELPFLLAGTVVLGGLFGYLLDRWLKTRPFGMLVLGAMGLYAGLRELLRRLKMSEKESDRNNEP